MVTDSANHILISVKLHENPAKIHHNAGFFVLSDCVGDTADKKCRLHSLWASLKGADLRCEMAISLQYFLWKFNETQHIKQTLSHSHIYINSASSDESLFLLVSC